MRRALHLAVAIALVAVSCGGEARPIFGDGSDTTAAAVPAGTSDAIVGSLGPVDGLTASLLAIDSGYYLDQLVADPGALRSDGSMAGIGPRGLGYGLIEGSSAAGAIRVTPGEILALAPPGTTHSLDDTWRAAETAYDNLGAVRLLGVPLGLEQEDVPDTGLATTEGATAMLGVLLALIDVGYSFDQALNGYLFGEWEVATGWDPTRESWTGLEDSTGVVFPHCIILLDDAGDVVKPELSGSQQFYGSETCRHAIDAELMELEPPAPPPDSSSSSTSTSTGGGDGAAVFEGRNMWADELKFVFWDGTSRTWLWPVDVTLELFPDGAAFLTLAFAPKQISFTCESAYVQLIAAEEGPLITAVGTHADGRFDFPDLGLTGSTFSDGEGREFAHTEWHRVTTTDGCPQGAIEVTRHLFFSIERTG